MINPVIAMAIWMVAIAVFVLHVRSMRRAAIRRAARHEAYAEVVSRPCQHKPYGGAGMHYMADRGALYYVCRLCSQVVRECRHLDREKVTLSTGEYVGFVCLDCQVGVPNEEWIKAEPRIELKERA